jgi:hypothetical protein
MGGLIATYYDRTWRKLPVVNVEFGLPVRKMALI